VSSFKDFLMAVLCGVTGMPAMQTVSEFDLYKFTSPYYFLWPPYVIGQDIIFLPCGFFLLSFFFFPHLFFFASKACIDNRKKLLSSNISSTCPHNMVNFGPVAAESCWRVWGTPANFIGFRVLAALLHGIPVLGVSQTLRR